MMVVGIGLSSYNIALFHLINHAFYKALLFLGAGSVIHAVADNQDLRKYGGLINYLPLTYSVMLIASLSLVAFPFMTGFYSKDFILESAYGQFNFSGAAGYIIATIGAVFTTLYSVKVLYLTFLANPNGTRAYYRLAIDNLFSNPQNYKPAHEGDFFLTSPLVILALFSIFFGFITKDIFIGMGSNLFVDNSLFIHPIHEIMIDTEFGVPVLFKLLPFIFTISFSVIALTLSELLSELVLNFKLSRLGYNIFGFFNQRFLIEFFYNKYITNLILNLGGQITKVLDKGSIELFGPFGLEKGLVRLSKNISSLSTSHVTSYALYILIGFVLYLFCSHGQFYLPLIFVMILLLIAGNDESNAETSPITSPRNTNYYDNKLKKNPLYIYNNKMMFSTSTPFFYSDNSGENPEPNSNPNEDGNNPDDEEAENNEGNNSNSNDNSENMEDSSNSENNPENNEDSKSNSDRDSDMDLDDPEDQSVEEIKDPEHNAPERIMDDLDQVDKARNGDPDALDYLRREFTSFFDDVSEEEALDDIEEYLENEFHPEHERSEREADDLDAEEARSKRPRSESPEEEEEEEEENNKRQKSKNEGDDGEDGNDSGGGDGTGSGSSGNNPSTSNRVIRLSPLEEIEEEDEYDFYPEIDDLWDEFMNTNEEQLRFPDLDLDMDTNISLIEILKALLYFIL